MIMYIINYGMSDGQFEKTVSFPTEEAAKAAWDELPLYGEKLEFDQRHSTVYAVDGGEVDFPLKKEQRKKKTLLQFLQSLHRGYKPWEDFPLHITVRDHGDGPYLQTWKDLDETLSDQVFCTYDLSVIKKILEEGIEEIPSQGEPSPIIKVDITKYGHVDPVFSLGLKGPIERCCLFPDSNRGWRNVFIKYQGEAYIISTEKNKIRLDEKFKLEYIKTVTFDGKDDYEMYFLNENVFLVSATEELWTWRRFMQENVEWLRPHNYYYREDSDEKGSLDFRAFREEYRQELIAEILTFMC